MVSIIIPVYNLENNIKFCIDSVLEQSYKNIEIIVVDDGSTDHSYEVCRDRQNKDARIKIIRQKNGGVSKARNTGIRQAQGEYIMFVDGDDIIVPNCLEQLLKNTDKDVSAVIGEIVRIRAYDFSFNEKEHVEHVFSGNDSLSLLLEGRFPISSCAALFRRECIGQIRFPEKIRHNEDKYFLFRFLLENGNMKVVRTSEHVYGYYVREFSATKGKWNGSTDVVKVADKIFSVVKEAKPELVEKAKIAMISARLQIIKDIVLAEDSKKYTGLYKKYRKEVIETGLPGSAGKRTKVMYIALVMGRWVFTLLAKLYYKVYSEEQRFKVNEKRTRTHN